MLFNRYTNDFIAVRAIVPASHSESVTAANIAAGVDGQAAAAAAAAAANIF